MSEIKALKKLRAAGRNMAKGRNLENHEECNLLLVIADEIQAEIDERFMELPIDADGVLIHVGEHVRGKYTDDKTMYKVHGFMFDFEHGQWNIALNESHFASSNLLVRCEPRTLEDVLTDFGRKFAENYHYPNADDLVDETADEIRELMKEGGE